VDTVHYSTHSYYHLPAVLLLSIGVGLLTERAIPFLSVRRAEFLSVRVALAGTLILMLGAAFGRLNPLPDGVSGATRRAEIDATGEVGSLLHHSTKVVFLAPSFGLSLEFYGGMAGTDWQNAQPESGVSEATARSTIEKLKETVGATFFVVTDMGVWQNEPGLRSYLSRYEVLGATADYRVYDLGKPTPGGV
jgi:hypothetical protein